MKVHYAAAHTKNQLAQKEVEVKQVKFHPIRKPELPKPVTDLRVEVEEEKGNHFNNLNAITNEAVIQFQFKLPVVKFLAHEGALQSVLDVKRLGTDNVFKHEDCIYKVYFFEVLLKEQRYMHRVMNEYAVSKQAKLLNLKHVIHLRSVHLGVNHIGFLLPRYQMDFRTYLDKERDPRHLNNILLQVGRGIAELHQLGYVHRDLKPENIVLNLKPV